MASSYPVTQVRKAQPIGADALPVGSLDLYTCDVGIGTGDELRQLVADGIIPAGTRFTLEWAAA